MNRPDNLTVAFLASLSESVSMLWRAELIGDSGHHAHDVKIDKFSTICVVWLRSDERKRTSSTKPEMRGYNRTGAFVEQLLPLQESHSCSESVTGNWWCLQRSTW